MPCILAPMQKIATILIIYALGCTTAFAHGEGVYSCNLALRADFEPSADIQIPPVIRIVTAHYETDDIGVLAWWGPHDKDPQNNARVEALGRGDAAIYTAIGLRWAKSKPELVMKPRAETWATGDLFWDSGTKSLSNIGSFTCQVFQNEY
ncbi:MAG: hypothetical protein AAF429_09595 [Pseudomonadota bacterium]